MYTTTYLAFKICVELFTRWMCDISTTYRLFKLNGLRTTSPSLANMVATSSLGFWYGGPIFRYTLSAVITHALGSTFFYRIPRCGNLSHNSFDKCSGEQLKVRRHLFSSCVTLFHNVFSLVFKLHIFVINLHLRVLSDIELTKQCPWCTSIIQ